VRFIDVGAHTHGAFKHWTVYGNQTISAIQTNEQQLLNLVLKRLEALKSEVKKKLAYFKTDVEAFTKRVSKTRSKTYSAIEQHEKMLFSRQQSNTLPSSPHITDPWLHERVLNELLIEMIDEENKFQSSMRNLFLEMGVFDAHVVEELKRILEEFGMLRGSMHSTLQAAIHHTTDLATQVDPTTYFSNLTTSLSLDSVPIWKEVRKLENFGFEAQDIQLMKTGLLYRQNMLGWWYPVQAVVTATGFFHCFELSRKHPLIEHYTKKDLSRMEYHENTSFSNKEMGVELGTKCDYRFSQFNKAFLWQRPDSLSLRSPDNISLFCLN
jgi:hypothetical protein